MLIADSAMDEGINWKINLENNRTRCIANALFLRGYTNEDTSLDAFSNKKLYKSWYAGDPFKAYVSPVKFNLYEKSAAIISNSSSITLPLNRVLRRATEMFDAKAYLHQYKNQGIESEYFEDMFLKMDQIVQNYEALASVT